jgi:DNA-binding GntR family transcriptional regulator
MKRRTAARGASEDVADEICSTLITAIAEQALKPGAKLSEEEIGSHFGVSRTVVRSALNRLQSERLVEFQRNRGAFVAEPSVEEAMAVFDARRVIERAIVERAVPRATAADIEGLDALTRHEEHVHAGADSSAKLRLAGNFHLRLARIAGNGVLTAMMETLVSRSSLVIALYSAPDADRCGANDHRQIIEAIAAKDAAAACQRMDEHLQAIEATARLTSEVAEARTLKDVLAAYAQPRPTPSLGRRRAGLRPTPA